MGPIVQLLTKRILKPQTLEGNNELNTARFMPLVSATFHSAANLTSSPSNVIVTSSDGVLFYVHLDKLASSRNSFRGALAPNSNPRPTWEHPLFMVLAADSFSLNIILHTLYGLSCNSFHPTLSQMITAVGLLKIYDCSLPVYLATGTPLYVSFLSQSPLRPIEAYTVAAENRLEDLACAISPHLLS